jgi:hypothetical protein
VDYKQIFTFELQSALQQIHIIYSWDQDMPTRALSARSSTESLQSSSSELSAPDKLIPAAAGPMVWEGAKLDPRDYVLELLKPEIENIRAAVVSFKCRFLHPEPSLARS